MDHPLGIGLHWVDLPCPRCGALETVGLTLSSVLTETEDDGASLRVRARSKPTDHMCGQTRIVLEAATLLSPGNAEP